MDVNFSQISSESLKRAALAAVISDAVNAVNSDVDVAGAEDQTVRKCPLPCAGPPQVGGSQLGQSRRGLSETRPIPRRGLSRTEAAIYIGLSTSKFDELVGDGRMPKPLSIDKRKVWDRYELDASFDALPRDNLDGWEDFIVDPGRRL